MKRFEESPKVVKESIFDRFVMVLTTICLERLNKLNHRRGAVATRNRSNHHLEVSNRCQSKIDVAALEIEVQNKRTN